MRVGSLPHSRAMPMIRCEMVLSKDIAHPPRRVCVHDERAPLSLLLSVLPDPLSVDSSFLTGLKIAHKSPLMTGEQEGRRERGEGIGTLAGGRSFGCLWRPLASLSLLSQPFVLTMNGITLNHTEDYFYSVS